MAKGLSCKCGLYTRVDCDTLCQDRGFANSGEPFRVTPAAEQQLLSDTFRGTRKVTGINLNTVFVGERVKQPTNPPLEQSFMLQLSLQMKCATVFAATAAAGTATN